MVGDLKTLRGEVALPLLIVGALGLLIIALQYGRLGLLLLTTSISSWLFFLGWDADPWLPLIMGLSVGVSYFLALVIKRAMVASTLRTLSAGVAFLGAFLIARPLTPAASPSLIRNFGLPASASAAQLDALPPHAVYMTEASWFLLTYLQSIEGYRKDVTLVYQPSILFPDYFAQTKLIDQKQNSFDSWALPSGASSDKNLGSFTDFASQLGEIDFEPNMLLNEFYQSIAQCDETGRTYLVRGQQKNCKEEFAEYVLYSSLSISTADAKYWSGFHSDTAHYFEGRLTSSADLLKRSNSIAAAINLLDRVCLWPQSSLCRLASLNNLAAYFLDAGNKRAAAAVLSKLVKDGYGASPAVRANLTQVQQHLDKNSVRELQNPD
jgi:hypothetical protein